MNKRQPEWDKTFLKIARNLGNMSHCVSRKVGAIAVLDGRILSSGINGSASKTENCCERFNEDFFDPIEHREWADAHEIHAEMNLLLFAAKFGISLNNCTIYSTLQPCGQCSKNLIQIGVRRIVFSEYYSRVTDTSDIKDRMVALGIGYDFMNLS